MLVSHIAQEQGAGFRPAAPPAFHLLAKPTGAVCNFDCSSGKKWKRCHGADIEGPLR